MSKVLVIGDSCVDIFEYGNCLRICPEAPVPILTPTKKNENYGMSMNVYANLIGLGVECDIITNEKKPIKSRFIDETSNQMILRIDKDDIIQSISWENLNKINYSKYDAVVISDYNKGFLNTEHIKLISQLHKLVFIDTKKKIEDWISNIKFIKINEKEFKESQNYLTIQYKHNVITTMGKNGAKLLFNNTDGEHIEKHFPIKYEHDVRDLTGAGDTFLSGLVAKYLTTNNINESIEFANQCASWAVTQKGLAVVSIDKIRKN